MLKNGNDAISDKLNKRFYIDVVDQNGKERTAEVLSAFTIHEYEKDFVVYTYNEVAPLDDITIYISVLEEYDDGYIFSGCTKDEIKSVLEVLKDMAGVEEDEDIFKADPTKLRMMLKKL